MLIGVPTSGNAQNILNNGGFETGLVCYGYWTWSNTFIDFKGDYRFTLSNDSHSGNKSMSISCIGSDCARAAIISEPIPAESNQDYLLTAWTKCPTGANGYYYVNDPDQSTAVTCNGNWAQSTFPFHIHEGRTSFTFYIFAYGNQTMLIDDMVLTRLDGTAPSRVTLHPGTRTTGISGRNVTVDGSPYLALGFFGVPLADINLVKATGANTIHGLLGPAVGDCFNYGTKSYLDTVYEAGMNFVMDTNSSTRMNDPSIFPAIQSTFGAHQANIAWFLADEPDLSQVPVFAYIDPTSFVASADAAKAVSSLPRFANMQHATYAPVTDETPYSPGVDFWMAEPYGEDFGLIKNASTLLTSIAPARPLWLAQNRISTSLIVPKAWWAIVNGTTGIFYFTWGEFKDNPVDLAAATQAFGELNTMQGAIFGSKMDNLVTAPSGVTTMSRFNQGTSYIMAVNPNNTAITGKYMVQGLAAGQPVTVMFENRTITASAGYFTDSFAGTGRHIYSITAPKTTLAANITGKSGPQNARVWTFNTLNSGLAAANNATISNVTFTRTGGTACTPIVRSGTFPVALGSLMPGASATGSVTVDFSGCDYTSKFTVGISLSANGGSTTATVNSANQVF